MDSKKQLANILGEQNEPETATIVPDLRPWSQQDDTVNLDQKDE